MIKKFIYNSSLPRTGSTLLQNVFNQNPDFHATPTSGVIEFLESARKNFIAAEFKAQDVKTMEDAVLAFCREGMKGFANSITDKPYFVDKSFYWGINFDYLKMIHGVDPKIVMMVRDPRDIFASFEYNYRKNPLVVNPNVNWDELKNTTMEKRIIDWTKTRPLGIVFDGLRDIINFKNAHKILFVKYEDFCENPDTEMFRIYNYLEVPFFKHDFNNVQQTTKENDVFYFASHEIRSNVAKKESQAMQIIGKPACDWLYKHYDWFFKYFKYNI